ncbi:hypothetical protein ABTX15_32260 [Micromonospora sp. NPDC094482]|uniref:hypothetical protein n=1 Tax=unclassified Micromonospora TaxID=2617518 RepID=UPI00332B29B7
MTMGLVASAVGVNNVPESFRALSSLPEIDYVDQFTLATDVEASPERWARAMFGNIPTLTELLIWRGLLHIRLAQLPSADTVAGWRIGGRAQDWIRLEAASWFLSGNLVVRTSHERVSLVTCLQFSRSVGTHVWHPLSVAHRQIVPGLLRATAERIRADDARHVDEEQPQKDRQRA